MPRAPRQRCTTLHPYRKIISSEMVTEKVLEPEGDWLGKTVKVTYELLACGHKHRQLRGETEGRKLRRCKECPGYVDKEDPEGRGIR